MFGLQDDSFDFSYDESLQSLGSWAKEVFIASTQEASGNADVLNATGSTPSSKMTNSMSYNPLLEDTAVPQLRKDILNHVDAVFSEWTNYGALLLTICMLLS